jgi:hypothetical protein
MVGNRFAAAVFAGVLLASTGCTMCSQPPEDYAYGAYGGIIDRADRFHGRVGSAFAPAEAGAAHAMEQPGLYAPPALPAEGTSETMEPAPPEGAAAAQSQPAASAFDPGDLLSSNEN